jgi:hypothetical protein
MSIAELSSIDEADGNPIDPPWKLERKLFWVETTIDCRPSSCGFCRKGVFLMRPLAKHGISKTQIWKKTNIVIFVVVLLYFVSYVIMSRIAIDNASTVDAEGYYFVEQNGRHSYLIHKSFVCLYYPLVYLDSFLFRGPVPASEPMHSFSNVEYMDLHPSSPIC